MKNRLTLPGGLTVNEFLRDYPQLRVLADERELLSLPEIPTESTGLLYQWYPGGHIFPSQVRSRS